MEGQNTIPFGLDFANARDDQKMNDIHVSLLYCTHDGHIQQLDGWFFKGSKRHRGW